MRQITRVANAWPLAGSVLLHAGLLAGLGFWSTGVVRRAARPVEFDIRVVTESPAASRAEGLRFSDRDLRSLQATTVQPPTPDARPWPSDHAVQPGADSANTNATPIDGDASGHEPIRNGDNHGPASGIPTANLGERERAGGSAVGGLWGVGKDDRATSFVYVLDRSGSMQDTFHLLQDELVRAIGSLGPQQRFDVIWFSQGPGELLSPELLLATPENKTRAFAAVRSIVPGGRTEPYDAIRHALLLRPNVVYLLSDGDFGEQNKPVLDLIRSNRRPRRTIIHTILFVYDNAGQGDRLLREIAEIGGGSYKHVVEEDLGP